MTILSIMNYDYNSFILSSLSNKGIIFSKLTKISHKFLEDLFPLFVSPIIFPVFQEAGSRKWSRLGWFMGPGHSQHSGDSSLSRDIFGMSNGTIMIYVALPNPWKSMEPPTFYGLVCEVHHFLIVRVCHHPQGSTNIFKMVVDFQVNVNEGTYKMLDIISIFRLKCRTLLKKNINWMAQSKLVGFPQRNMKEMAASNFCRFVRCTKKGRKHLPFFWAHVSCCWGVVTWTCRWGSDYRTFCCCRLAPLKFDFHVGFLVNGRHMTYVSSITTCWYILNQWSHSPSYFNCLKENVFSLYAGCSYSVGTCLFASAILLGSLVDQEM